MAVKHDSDGQHKENVISGDFKTSLLSASTEKPYIMTFGDNEPHGYTMNIYPFLVPHSGSGRKIRHPFGRHKKV